MAAFKFGELRHRCLIERKVVTQDPDYGTEVITWQTVATVWANIEDVLPSKSEAVKSGLDTATQQTRVRIRWRDDIDSTMRVTINRPAQTLYQIAAGPAELGSRQGLEFMVEHYSS